jgi:hypothetical protein
LFLKTDVIETASMPEHRDGQMTLAHVLYASTGYGFTDRHWFITGSCGG